MTAIQRTRTENGPKASVERILDAATKMCRRYGFSKTTVADVAGDLRTSTANIYRHFPSKFAMFNELVARVLADNLVCATELAEASSSERLGEYIRQSHCRLVALRNEEHRLYEMVAVSDEESWPAFQEYARSVHRNIAEVIERGIREGEFQRQDSLRAAACVCMSTAALWRPAALKNLNASAETAVTDDLIAFCLASLRDRNLDGHHSPASARGGKQIFRQSLSTRPSSKTSEVRLETEQAAGGARD